LITSVTDTFDLPLINTFTIINHLTSISVDQNLVFLYDKSYYFYSNQSIETFYLDFNSS